MYTKSAWKKNRQVVKLLSGAGTETASIRTVHKCDTRKGFVYLDADDMTDDGPNTYQIETGRANVNWIPGFSSRIVPVEE